MLRKLAMHRCLSWLLLLCLGISLNAQTSQALDEEKSLALLVATIQQTKSRSVQAALLKGMLKGLEGRRGLGAPEGWSALGASLRHSEDETIRKATNQLSQIFGDEAVIAEAMATLRNANANVEARTAALRSLVNQKHTELATELEPLLSVPELQLDVIRAFGVIENKDAPRILLSKFKDFGEQQQRAIIETLATRKNYARVLVSAVKDKRVPHDQIPSYLARSLHDMLGDGFVEAYGEIPEMKQDVKGMIAKYKSIITDSALAKASASNGRAVYQKTCAACHMMYGSGGKIGPDLTGSNRKNIDYLLLNSLDPSADVPEGYRMVIIQTVDGRVLNGVIAEENNQRVVLKTVDQPELVIAKDDIETRKVSEKSMMPEGQLQQMKRKDLLNLVRYMQTTEQVEMPQ